MDNPILIIGIIVMLLFIAPLYYVMKPNKIDHNKVQSIFTAHNQNDKYNFQVHLADKKKILGLDVQKRGLLYIDFNQKDPYVRFVNLKEQKNCKLVTSAPESNNRFKKLAFHFDAAAASEQKKEITFYDANEQYIVPVYAQEEYQLAQKWHEAIRAI